MGIHPLKTDTKATHTTKTFTKTDQVCVERTTCRICGSSPLKRVIDLGEQYIASRFVGEDVPKDLRRAYPLELVRCAEKDKCGLVQLRHSIQPSLLYCDYGYRSGINESMRSNLAEIARKAEELVRLKKGDTVLDIGCNDGTLLASYQTRGIDRLGFDPAENVARSAREIGFEVVIDFFSAQGYRKVRPNVKAKIITSIAMFYDLESPTHFVRDIASILHPEGVWVIELSYLPSMLRKNAFDTICHEHLEYYALSQIEWMLEKEGLKVQRVELNEVNGGSIRLFIGKKESTFAGPDNAREVERMRRDEKSLGLDSDQPYSAFCDNVLKVRDDLRRLLLDLARAGKTVYLYGASTKGNVIIQFFGIDKTWVLKAADRNPDKWGKRTLGTDIPIISEEQARTDKPDYFLVLPWHFFEGFKQRERTFLEGGGKFIVPLPEVKVVGKECLSSSARPAQPA